MPVCPQRTVQSINKFKQKNAENKRCVCPPLCPLPSATAVTQTGPRSYTVLQSGGTSFQWWYIFKGFEYQLNGPGITGSTTPTITFNFEAQGPFLTIYCIVSNQCGSATSPGILAQIGGGEGDN
jgi:hypothetical protein